MDYIVLFAMMLALAMSELGTPYQRYIYEPNDQASITVTAVKLLRCRLP